MSDRLEDNMADDELDKLVNNIDADWWNDGQTSYEDGEAEQERTKAAINAYTTNKIIEEWNIIHETLHSATLVEQAHIDKVMNERIKALNHRKDEK